MDDYYYFFHFCFFFAIGDETFQWNRVYILFHCRIGRNQILCELYCSASLSVVNKGTDEGRDSLIDAHSEVYQTEKIEEKIEFRPLDGKKIFYKITI